MSRHALVPATLALLAVLAGCSSLGSSGPETATLTPAEVPTSSAGPVPGVDDDRVADRATLAAAHESVLSATSYRLVQDRWVNRSGDGNGTLNRVRLRLAVEPGATAYSATRLETSTLDYRAAAPYARVDIWYRDGVVRNRFVDASNLTRRWGTNDSVAGGPLSTPTRAASMTAPLAAFRFEVVDERTVDGSTRYTLAGDRLVRPRLLDVPATVRTPRNATLRAVVSADGVVRSYDVRFDATYDGEPVRVRVRGRVRAVGNTSVGQPGWLPAANASVADRGEPS